MTSRHLKKKKFYVKEAKPNKYEKATLQNRLWKLKEMEKKKKN